MDELHQLHDYLGFVPVKEYERLKAQNAELVRTLTTIKDYCGNNFEYTHFIYLLCDDALAKVE